MFPFSSACRGGGGNCTRISRRSCSKPCAPATLKRCACSTSKARRGGCTCSGSGRSPSYAPRLSGRTFLRESLLSAGLVRTADLRPQRRLPDGHSAEAGGVHRGDRQCPAGRGGALGTEYAGSAPTERRKFSFRGDGGGAGTVPSAECAARC